MLSYDKWKLLNESLNRPSTLGISQPTKLGLISNQPLVNSSDENLEECGCDYEEEEEDFEDEDGDETEVNAEEFDSPEGDGETVSVHSELGDENDAMDDEGDDGMEDDDEDEDEDEGDEDEDEDMEDEDEDDEEDEDEGDEDEDEDMEDEDEDDEEDEDMEDEDEDEGDEEDDEHPMHAHPKHMEMPESKKLPKGMISETAWWSSVKSMIGNMSPSGDIKEDTAAPADADPEDAKLDAMLDRARGLPGDVKSAAKVFIKQFFAHESGAGSKGQLLNFIDILLDMAVEKAVESDKATFNQIKTHLRGHLNTLEKEEMGAW